VRTITNALPHAIRVTPGLISRPIYIFGLLHRLFAWRRHNTHECYDYLLVTHFVNGDGHVSRLHWTGVHVAVILRNEIDVVKDKALETVLLQRFDERYVHDARLVECVVAVLETDNR